MLVHTVLISFKPEAPAAAKEKVFDLFQTLAERCGGPGAGILYFEVKHNLDLRKGVHLVEVAIFTDNASLQRFRVHPAHMELTNLLREHADWQVGDYETDALVLPAFP